MSTIADSLTLDIVEKACNSFVIVNVAISKPSFTKTLPKTITAKIAAMIASGSGEGKVVPPKSVVDLFGDKQRDFNKRVLAPLGALRNRLYERPELDGGRAFTTAEFPAAYPGLQADRDEIMGDIQITAEPITKHGAKPESAAPSGHMRVCSRMSRLGCAALCPVRMTSLLPFRSRSVCLAGST